MDVKPEAFRSHFSPASCHKVSRLLREYSDGFTMADAEREGLVVAPPPSQMSIDQNRRVLFYDVWNGSKRGICVGRLKEETT